MPARPPALDCRRTRARCRTPVRDSSTVRRRRDRSEGCWRSRRRVGVVGEPVGGVGRQAGRNGHGIPRVRHDGLRRAGGQKRTGHSALVGVDSDLELIVRRGTHRRRDVDRERSRDPVFGRHHESRAIHVVRVARIDGAADDGMAEILVASAAAIPHRHRDAGRRRHVAGSVPRDGRQACGCRRATARCSTKSNRAPS